MRSEPPAKRPFLERIWLSLTEHNKLIQIVFGSSVTFFYLTLVVILTTPVSFENGDGITSIIAMISIQIQVNGVTSCDIRQD